MHPASPTRPAGSRVRAPASEPPRSELPPSAAFAPRRVLLGLSWMVSSQGVLALAGLASLPVLARALGAQEYGAFSLYVTLLGVVAQADFARALLVPELSRADGVEPPPDGLARLNGLVLAAGAAVVGLAFLTPAATVALVVGALLHAAASRDFARLSARGHVGPASAVRNLAWAAALAGVVALAVAAPASGLWPWPFCAANLAILLVYRRLLPPEPARAGGVRAAWRARRGDVLDLLGFSLAVAVVTSADKLLLRHATDAAELGRYLAHYDLAAKVNILSTALGATLYPLLARAVRDEGVERAARRFVRLASGIALGYLVVLGGLAAAAPTVSAWVLGSEYAAGAELYPLLLVGVFVHLFGFLITPWQRARGDFRTQRRAYHVAAGVMLVTGVLLVPRLGAWGAVCAYLAARTAELLLVAHEARTLPAGALPKGRLALGAAALVLLAGTAAWRAGVLA